MPTLLFNTLLSSAKQLFFNISDAGWYIIKISAKVKNEKQRSNNATDDEEMIVMIDGMTFPKPGTKQALYNSPAAFNGGEQHNIEKTIYFLIELQQGGHILSPLHHSMERK